MERRIEVVRKVEIEPTTIKVFFDVNGYQYPETVSREVSEKLRIPYRRAYNKINKAFQEFYEIIKEKYQDAIFYGSGVVTESFETVSDVKEFIKFVTNVYSNTIAKAIRELKKENSIDELEEWLIKDYKIVI